AARRDQAETPFSQPGRESMPPNPLHQCRKRSRLCLTNPNDVVVYLTVHETARIFGPTMGALDALLPAATPPSWRPVERRPYHPQRHLLAAQHRCPLA